MTQINQKGIPTDQEFQLITALLSTNFVFLGFLLSISEETDLFKNTFINIPFVFSIQLYNSIFSNLLLSFILLCVSLWLYFETKKNNASFNGYRGALYLGLFYWISLFLNILYLLDLKYLNSASFEMMLLNIITYTFGLAVLMAYMIVKVFPGPQFKECTIFPQLLWVAFYLVFWWQYIKWFKPTSVTVFSPFNYLWAPYAVMFILTFLSEKIVHKLIPRLAKIF